MVEIDSYTRSDGEIISLEKDGDTFVVSNWGVNGDEHRWTVKGRYEGGVEDAMGRNDGGEWIPFTEADARAEFERWRS